MQSRAGSVAVASLLLQVGADTEVLLGQQSMLMRDQTTDTATALASGGGRPGMHWLVDAVAID
jgi:hypothetical protein